LGFLYEDRTRKYDPIANGLSKHRILLTKDKSPVSEGEEHHVKNDDEIDESHKSQLQFEYEIYLLSYTINFLKPTLGFSGFRFLKTYKNLGF